MTEVMLHVYDVTNSDSEKTNNTIVQINKFFKDGIGLGGIFHSAVQVFFHLYHQFMYSGCLIMIYVCKLLQLIMLYTTKNRLLVRMV